MKNLRVLFSVAVVVVAVLLFLVLIGSSSAKEEPSYPKFTEVFPEFTVEISFSADSNLGSTVVTIGGAKQLVSDQSLAYRPIRIDNERFLITTLIDNLYEVKIISVIDGVISVEFVREGWATDAFVQADGEVFVSGGFINEIIHLYILRVDHFGVFVESFTEDDHETIYTNFPPAGYQNDTPVIGQNMLAFVVVNSWSRESDLRVVSLEPYQVLRYENIVQTFDISVNGLVLVEYWNDEAKEFQLGTWSAEKGLDYLDISFSYLSTNCLDQLPHFEDEKIIYCTG